MIATIVPMTVAPIADRTASWIVVQIAPHTS